MDELPPIDAVAVVLFELLITPKEKIGALARKIAEQADKVQMELLLKILTYKNITEEEIKTMLEIEEELLKDTPFYKEVFAKGKQEGEQIGKLATVPLLRELGLSDEQIAEKLKLPLADVQGVPRT